METVEILLATYNGIDYLRELFDSLNNQTYSHIRVIACDDGSSDETFSTLKKIQEEVSFPMEVHQNRGNIGVIKTFSKLMALSKAPYVMFCDQDDVWKTDKVESTLEAMKGAEWCNGPDIPILVHTDLEVVDQDLKPLAFSYWGFTHIYPEKTTTLNRLMVQNVVTGCTAMMNRSLVETCGPIPFGAIMHDWWVALVAAAFGKIVALPKSTVYYRQHASNCLGAKKCYSFTSLKESLYRQRSMNYKKQRQIQKFASAYNNMLTSQCLELINSYTSFRDQSWLKRLFLTIKHRFYRQGLGRNLAAIALNLSE